MQRNPIMQRLMCLALVACIAVTVRAESGQALDDTAAKEAGWTLAFEDDFERDELGDQWQPVAGVWEIVDGALRGSGTIVTATGFPPSDEPAGYQRVELLARTDVKPLAFLQVGEQDVEPRISDLSVLLQAKKPEPDSGEKTLDTGYFFQFGGYWNTQNQIRQKGKPLVVEKDPKIRIKADQLHHIVVENDMGHLRLLVDGKLALEKKQRMSLFGQRQNRIGFYFHTAAKVEQVKVYVKQLPDGYDRD